MKMVVYVAKKLLGWLLLRLRSIDFAQCSACR